MNWIWIIALALAGNAQAQEPQRLLGAADVAGWVASGAAEAKLPPMEAGGLADLFDGNPRTHVTCGEEGQAVFTFTFDQAIPLHQVGLIFCSPGITRWYAEISGGAGGKGFTPLFNWRFVEGNKRDAVPLKPPPTVGRIRIVAERRTLGTRIMLEEIELYTSLEIKAVRLDQPPREARVGVPISLYPVALDPLGGRISLDRDVQWKVHPRGMVKINGIREGAHLCMPQRSGKVKVGFLFGTLAAPEQVMRVSAPDPPPSQPQVIAFPTSAHVSLAKTGPGQMADHPNEPDPAQKNRQPYPAHAVYLRKGGDPPVQAPSALIHNGHCTFSGLEPERVYLFSLAGLDPAGYPITLRSEEERIRTPAAQTKGVCRLAHIRMLVPIYTRGYAPEEVEAIIRGFELARLFIFRHSKARLNVNLEYVKIPGELPQGQGPGLDGLHLDLLQRGLLTMDFDGVHGVAQSLEANLSGYRFPNGAIGSAGVTAQAFYPGHERTVNYAACWTLLHEFQHSLDRVLSRKGTASPMLQGHFLDNYPLAPGEVFDAGDFYAGQAELFKRFEQYLDLPEPWTAYLETADRDQDGLPDQDPRLPADEARFGSDPGKGDTDGDGLPDLAEFCAGIYSGSDPLSPDTDGDELPDAADPYPLSDFSGLIPHGTVLRGEIPPGLLSTGFFYCSREPGPTLEIHASWDERFLYFAFESTRPLDIAIHLDGSGHLGPFESDAQASDVYTGETALHLSFGNPRLLKGTTPVEGAKILSAEKGGKHLLWAAIPAALGEGTPACHLRAADPGASPPGPGLTLKPDRILGLAFTAVLQGQPKSRCWTYEPHAFYDARTDRTR